MSSNISITAPFVPRFTHADVTLSTTTAEVLAASVTPEKRVSLIIQNKDASIAAEIILDSSGSTGLILAAGASLSLDSYKGAVRAKSASGTPTLHIAYAVI
jgi:hypothetical protein